MRIRWNETDVEEVKTFSFVPYYNANNEDDWGMAIEVESEYVAYINSEKFSSLADAEKWAEKQTEEILVKGYYDLTKLIAKDYIYLV